jgi:hypothetical protein
MRGINRELTIVRSLSVSLFTMAFLPIASAQAPILGDWHGTLRPEGQQLRVVLHIRMAKDGSLHAMLDSVDQAAIYIPVTAISISNSKLSFTVDAIHGSYQGTVNNDVTEIHGTWSQRESLPLDFSRGPLPAEIHLPAPPSDIDGAWMGTIDAGPEKLRVIFRIKNTQDGLIATVDNLGQGHDGYVLTATSVTRNGDSLRIELKQLDGVLDAQVGNDLKTISGTWTQHAHTFPLALNRMKE